jgi:hypothetical protein
MGHLLEQARETETRLRTTLDAARAALVEIDAERASRAFSAHTSADDLGRRALEKLNRKKTDLLAETGSLEIALEEAQRRVKDAERDAELSAERERARAVLNYVAEFKRAAKAIDDGFAKAVAEYGKLRAALLEMHALGCTSPTLMQLKSLGHRAAMTALMGSDLALEHLAPRERRHFGDLIGEWSARIEHWAAQRIGDEQKE